MLYRIIGATVIPNTRLKTENHNSRIKEGRLTTLRVSNEAENGEPQLQKK